MQLKEEPHATTANLRHEHVSEQLPAAAAAHVNLSKSGGLLGARSVATLNRHLAPLQRRWPKRPLKSLKTKWFRLISGRAASRRLAEPPATAEDSRQSEESEPGQEEAAPAESVDEDSDDSSMVNIPPVQAPTPAQKHRELIHLRGLLQFRIAKQQQLLRKIKMGKWKSERHGVGVLHGLAKNDLRLLAEEAASVDAELVNLSNCSLPDQHHQTQAPPAPAPQALLIPDQTATPHSDEAESTH